MSTVGRNNDTTLDPHLNLNQGHYIVPTTIADMKSRNETSSLQLERPRRASAG